MLIVGVVPLLTGQIHAANYGPLVPARGRPPRRHPAPGTFPGWTLVFGGMFLAAWSTYGFETAVAYTSEFKNPGTDTFKAIFFSGLLCIVLYILVPFTFQGVLGLDGMLAGPIGDGSGRRRRHGDDGRRWRAGPRAPRHDDGAGPAALHHDRDGWLVPHPLPGLGGRLAAALPQPPQQPRLADARHVDRPRGQPVRPGDRLGGRDELLLHPGRVELRLHRLQLPEPERRLDPQGRQRRPAPALARADLAARPRHRLRLS